MDIQDFIDWLTETQNTSDEIDNVVLFRLWRDFVAHVHSERGKP